ncbi:hypothetical protein, partial [Sinorhizobium meliloti]|uniref:hypothetical protein n=1 Tax=Rhizobium meliloti TaxID=382 RepID=UPI001AEC9A4B
RFRGIEWRTERNRIENKPFDVPCLFRICDSPAPRGETISGLTFTYESQNALEAPCRNPARKVKLLPDSL